MRKLAGAILLSALPFVTSACGEGKNYTVNDVHRMIDRNSGVTYFVKDDVAYKSSFSENGMLITIGSKIGKQSPLASAKPNSLALSNYFYYLSNPDIESWMNPNVTDSFAAGAYTPKSEDRYVQRGAQPEFGNDITPEHRKLQNELVRESGRALEGFTFFR